MKDGISEAGNVRAGVPQGSVLDSRLLIVYINDIADEVLGLCRLFAYDTSICHSAHDEHTLVNLTDIDLSNISKWSEQWFVKLNPDKTDIRDRPFNLKGGLWFFVSEMFYRTTQELEYLFFCRAKTLNQIYFFLHQNQNIFFSNIANQNIFLEKKHNPPLPLQVKWSFP